MITHLGKSQLNEAAFRGRRRVSAPRKKRRYTRSQEHQECIAFYDWYLKQQKQFRIPTLIVHIANEFSGDGVLPKNWSRWYESL